MDELGFSSVAVLPQPCHGPLGSRWCPRQRECPVLGPTQLPEATLSQIIALADSPGAGPLATTSQPVLSGS